MCLQPLRAAGRRPAPNQLCWGGWPGALSAVHRTRVLLAESSLYLWDFAWVVTLSWVWTGVFVLCAMRLTLVLLTLSCVHLKLSIFFVPVARGSCTVTFCWGKRKRNYSLPDLDGSNMLWCLPVWTVSARSWAHVRTTAQNHHPWIIHYHHCCKLSHTALPKGKM